jgi:hypothetical protein
MIGTARLRPIDGTFRRRGALDIDIARPLDAETLAWIEQAFREPSRAGDYPEQDLGPASVAAFGRCFGKPKRHALVD